MIVSTLLRFMPGWVKVVTCDAHKDKPSLTSSYYLAVFDLHNVQGPEEVLLS